MSGLRASVVAKRREALKMSETSEAVAEGLRAWVDQALADGADPQDVAAALADAAGYAAGHVPVVDYETSHTRTQRAFDARRRATFREQWG